MLKLVEDMALVRTEWRIGFHAAHKFFWIKALLLLLLLLYVLVLLGGFIQLMGGAS